MINKVILIGNVGRINRTSDNGPVAMTVATHENFRDQSGEWIERTEWHNVSMWGDFGARMLERIKTGDTVYVEGAIRTRKVTKDGVDRYFTDIAARTVTIVSRSRNDATAEPPVPEAAGADDIPF